ncbi:hypothetical protein Q0Z83_086430 [Actinoplanes sichuanensis]|uniref:Spore-associated protein A n=1 Tax=Actinoplanes sichuanensis TaxID=512349 RepID=A0ABW4AK95_9ACTN|nr:hypothetical protein [Actinoplanes sichuanensis]BEL10452.1 hypothetical protein Q0Z83_086430 [Actinoplanes sichuanensis]
MLKTRLATALVAGVTAIVAHPAPASAADVNPYSASALCGSGYGIVDYFKDDGRAYIYLLYNSGNGKNCVVSLKQKNLGTKTHVSAVLETRDDVKVDPGNYAYYAGPIYLSARNECVSFGGEVTVNGQLNVYKSPFRYCD